MAKKRSTATRRATSEAAAARAAAIRREQEQRERRRRTLIVVAALAVVAVVATGVVALVDRTGQPATPPNGAVATYAVPAGSGDAPVQVAVYEDFMCPFCGQFESASRETLPKAVDDGKVEVRYHVLNFLDDASSTEYSTRSANALAVVLDTSGPEVAKRFHDLLFENQPEEGSAGLADAKLVDLAVRAGASRQAVSPGITDRTFEQWVDNGKDQASKDGVNATPTVMVDGKKLTYKTIDELVSELDKAITAAS
jgi:protein-disulfide isomerase